jgi:hypothetical protein
VPRRADPIIFIVTPESEEGTFDGRARTIPSRTVTDAQDRLNAGVCHGQWRGHRPELYLLGYVDAILYRSHDTGDQALARPV